MGEWISVKDQLPDEQAIILTWGAHSVPWVCYYIEGMWYDVRDENDYLVGITHWMPLPEPPEDV